MKNFKIKLASIGIILAVIISIMGTNASSVLAEDNNKSINIHIAVVGMYNEVIFKPQQITVNYEGEKSTAQDGLNAAGLDSTVNDQGMITSINNEENGTDDGYYGSQSGWMYKVNFMVPSDFPKNQVISDGDYLLFVYAKDHYDLLPSYDSYQNDFVNVTVKGIQKENSFSQPVTVLKNNSVNSAIMQALKANDGSFDRSSLPSGMLMSNDGYVWSYILNDDEETYNDSSAQLNEGDVITTFKDNGDNLTVENLTLNKSETSLIENETLQLNANIYPDSLSNAKIKWTSDQPEIASVDEFGNVTALKPGTAVITAESEDNKNAGAQCKITVKAKGKLIDIIDLATNSSFNLGEDAKVSVKAENNCGKDQNTSLITALYDEKNKFVSYVCGSQIIKNGGSSVLTAMMKLPERGVYKLKAFVWDSLEEMNSISDVIEIPVK